MGFNFIVIVPSPHHLVVASPLSLDVGYLYLVGVSILLSMVVQKLVGTLTGEGHMSLYPAMLDLASDRKLRCHQTSKKELCELVFAF